MPSMRANVFGMSLADLEQAIVGLGEPVYHARQIYCWL